MRPAPGLGNLALRTTLIVLGLIFVVELAIMIMLALTVGEGRHHWLEVIVDSSVLTVTMAPLLYWLIVRPLGVLADERSRLLAHMIEIQDTERQRVARDLHDEIGQSFTSLLVQLRMLEESPTLEAARSQARAVRELSGQVYDQIRSLARGLYPTVLDDLGLVEAVQRMAEDFESTHQIPVIVTARGFSGRRLNRKIEATAYRIVQESLTNCAKHARASEVEITLALERDTLTVTIDDNGRGFDADKIQSQPAATFGLASMRERAVLVDGSLTVRARPAGGTTVTLRIPVRN